MNKTAKQPDRGQATNQHPAPTTDRPHKVYHKRTALDKLILGVVIAIALVVIALSFSNTALLARELGLNEYLTAGLVEILFASLLFIRGRQRATMRNVPLFLSIGYFASLGFVTGVNMYGLYQESAMVGPVVGATISGAMWLMESTLVWLWTSSHKPHKKSAKELEREAKKEIEEIKIMQKIDWMKWEAQKPSLDLIKQARREEEKRKTIVAEGIPEFFKETTSNSKQKTHTKHQTLNSKSQTSNTEYQTVSYTQKIEGQTNKQTGYDQMNEQDQPEQTAQTKQDESKQTEATEQKDNKQTPDEHRTNKDEANTKQEPIDEQTDDQTNNAQKDTEQTNNEQTNKVIYINNKQTRQTQTNTSNKQEKQTNNEQQAEQADKQTQRKHASTKQTRRTVKQTANVPTYEQLLEMIDQTFEANKKLPTVRAFAQQTGIKPYRAHKALTMWKEANGQTAANN